MSPPAATAAPLFLSFSAALLPLPLPPRRLPCSPVQSTLLPHRSPPPPTGAGSGAGSGAAAPNPTDVFLLRHYSAKAAADAKRKHTKNKKPPPPAVSPVVACCYGCGAPLQTDEADAPGYVDTDTYQLKKRHRQLRTLICGRCKLLAHGHIITAVGGHGGYAGGKQFVTAEQLREKLSHLRYEKALIVKLVDIVDFNGSFLVRIRDLVGANPIILVVTKVDLLPKGTDLNCVADWVVEANMKKKLNVLSVHLTSSKSLLGIAGVVSQIQKEKKGRDVYILGAANVGKSAFISALLKMMGEKDPVAAAAQKYKPIQSAVPGTTLGPIQIEAFLNGGKIFDTPGVHLHHRQAAVVDVEDLPCLAPQSRLKSQLPTLVDSRLNGQSLFWGGLVRVDILEVPPTASLTFYGPRQLQIYTVPTAEAEAFYKEEIGITLTPPTGWQRAEEWPGLQTVRHLNIKFEDTKRPASDIAISGLGWIVVNPMSRNDNFISSEQTSGELRLSVYVPKAVEIFLRSPIPVGKAGGEWYEFKDLTEKEEEERPRWFI